MAEIGLAAADLQLIVCSTGPGSFTGIRIGLATAKGIAFGLSCPLIGVSSLDAFALPYSSFTGDLYPVIDARKGKIYTALYRGGERRSDYLDVTPAELRERLAGVSERVLFAGPDAGAIRTLLCTDENPVFVDRISAVSYSDPLALLDAGELAFARVGADPGEPVPLYLRKSEAEIGAGR